MYYKYRNLDAVKGVLNGLHPAVAAMVLAAAVKIVGNAWWGGIEQAAPANTDGIAVVLALIFLVLLQKKNWDRCSRFCSAASAARCAIILLGYEGL